MIARQYIQPIAFAVCRQGRLSLGRQRRSADGGVGEEGFRRMQVDATACCGKVASHNQGVDFVGDSVSENCKGSQDVRVVADLEPRAAQFLWLELRNPAGGRRSSLVGGLSKMKVGGVQESERNHDAQSPRITEPGPPRISIYAGKIRSAPKSSGRERRTSTTSSWEVRASSPVETSALVIEKGRNREILRFPDVGFFQTIGAKPKFIRADQRGPDQYLVVRTSQTVCLGVGAGLINPVVKVAAQALECRLVRSVSAIQSEVPVEPVNHERLEVRPIARDHEVTIRPELWWDCVPLELFAGRIYGRSKRGSVHCASSKQTNKSLADCFTGAPEIQRTGRVSGKSARRDIQSKPPAEVGVLRSVKVLRCIGLYSEYCPASNRPEPLRGLIASHLVGRVSDGILSVCGRTFKQSLRSAK